MLLEHQVLGINLQREGKAEGSGLVPTTQKVAPRSRFGEITLMKLPGKSLTAGDRDRGAGDNSSQRWLQEEQPSSTGSRGALGSPLLLTGDPC